MAIFPFTKIVPTKAKLKGEISDASIEVFLEPFELVVENNLENVNTTIRLNTINIPVIPKLLEERTFVFPVNPSLGYIDGSIYFFAVHNPIDVTEITFGKILDKTLPIELKCRWELEFERTGFKNFKSTIKTQIEL